MGKSKTFLAKEDKMEKCNSGHKDKISIWKFVFVLNVDIQSLMKGKYFVEEIN